MNILIITKFIIYEWRKKLFYKNFEYANLYFVFLDICQNAFLQLFHLVSG